MPSDAHRVRATPPPRGSRAGRGAVTPGVALAAVALTRLFADALPHCRGTRQGVRPRIVATPVVANERPFVLSTALSRDNAAVGPARRWQALSAGVSRYDDRIWRTADCPFPTDGSAGAEDTVCHWIAMPAWRTEAGRSRQAT